jgi:penicillin G amidase
MATATLSPSSTRRPTLVRIAVLIAAVFLLCILIAASWFYWAAHSSLPQVDGTLKVAGLKGPVSVLRDGRGMPHIRASSMEDAIFAQGYVTAQDRLWQMDITRRFAAGELAELLGSDLLRNDRKQRVLMLPEVAERAAAALSTEERALSNAYCEGVNAFIESHRDRLPIEFRVLRYQPKPWRVQDSFLIGANMMKALNHGTANDERIREIITAKLGPELTGELYPQTSVRDHPPTEPVHASNRKNKQEDPSEDDPDFAPDSQISDDVREEPVPGSNNWVVSGAHTASGKPLLSNDMHLDYGVPGIWYEVQLEVPGKGFDVAGVSLPGAPFVIVGHNQRIAWGFTNVEPDVEDLYVEQFNEKGEYLTPQGWKQPERRREVIHVKGQPDTSFDMIVTRHGPIVSELFPGETRKLALHWTVYDKPISFSTFIAADAAQNWTEFRKAFSQLSSPGQNVVYADVDGHVGYQATGQFPIRKAGDGSVPVSGADDAHEWVGTIPYEKLPSTFDPPDGIVATANARMVPDGYPYPISTYFDVPFRTQRIYSVLQSGRRFDASDMLSLQMDVYSDFEKSLADRFVAAVDHTGRATPRAKEAAELLRSWDGRVKAESPAANIIVFARRAAVREILEPRLSAVRVQDLSEDEKSIETKALLQKWLPSATFLENVLRDQPARWLPQKYKSYDELLVAALDRAVTGEKGSFKIRSWTRAKEFPSHFEHPIFGRIPWLRAILPQSITGPGIVSLDGDQWTVKANGRYYGPSERITINLANFDSSTMNIVTGQSGQPLSPHYLDHWSAWLNGSTFPWRFSDAAVDQAAVHRLTLEP